MRDRPVLLALCRQNVPTISRTRYTSAEDLRRGAYVLTRPGNRVVDRGDDRVEQTPELILMASGSEVSLILSAAVVL